MNRYQPSTPRAAFGIVAIVMTALTLGVGVFLPATLSPSMQQGGTVAAARFAAPASTEVAIIPARINVIGVRDATVAGGSPTALPAKSSHRG